MTQSGIQELFAPSRRRSAVPRLLPDTREAASLSPHVPPGSGSAARGSRAALTRGPRLCRALRSRPGSERASEEAAAFRGGVGEPSGGGFAPRTPCAHGLPQACACLAWVIAVVAADRGEKNFT